MYFFPICTSKTLFCIGLGQKWPVKHTLAHEKNLRPVRRSECNTFTDLYAAAALSGAVLGHVCKRQPEEVAHIFFIKLAGAVFERVETALESKFDKTALARPPVARETPGSEGEDGVAFREETGEIPRGLPFVARVAQKQVLELNFGVRQRGLFWPTHRTGHVLISLILLFKYI